MKFKDPHKVECPHCGMESEYRVADLLALTAACTNCRTSLAEQGQAMRRIKDEVGNCFGLVFLSLALERRLGAKFADEDLEPVKTLRDLVGVVEPRLPAHGNVHSRALALVATALTDLQGERRPAAGSIAPEELDLDVPLIDAIDPDRWART